MIAALEPWAREALAVGAALAAGALIGIERGWKLRGEKEGSRVAGVRTFTMLGLAGGIAGLIGARGQPLAGAILLAAAAAIMVFAYALVLKAQRDATSAVAALVTLAIGFLAGSGSPGLATVCAAIVLVVLALRSELHRFVGRLDEADVKALARFALIAGAVLPLLPNQPMGPYDAWNPQKLWLVVVLVTGFSFAGYIANRLFGARHGTIATALIGGAYSSTAVTISLSQALGAGKGGGPEPGGIALATAVMYLRVLVLVALLATSVLVPFAILILPALAVGVAAGLFLVWKSARSGDETQPPGNPIQLLPALGFLVFVAVAAVAARWAEGRFGEQGIAVLLLITGSLDVDAAIITTGGLKPGTISPALAALALGGTVMANMAVKVGVTLAYARSRGISAALALGASMVALGIGLWFGWMRL